MTNELWKDILGYEGMYQISNLGQVLSSPRIVPPGRRVRGRIMRLGTTNHGYRNVQLSKLGIAYPKLVHRLVAEAFIFNEGNKPEVNHKNGDKNNNTTDNLEWMTEAENMRHSAQVLRRHIGETNEWAKLDEDEVLHIRSLWFFGATRQTLADAFSISRDNINRILKRSRWTHV